VSTISCTKVAAHEFPILVCDPDIGSIVIKAIGKGDPWSARAT
jgi:hypothetical protein